MSILTWLQKRICPDCGTVVANNEKTISDLNVQLTSCNSMLKTTDDLVSDLQTQLTVIQSENADLKKQLNHQQVEGELEKYWNNKRPSSETLLYPARPLPYDMLGGNIPVDPRIFWGEDSSIPMVTGSTNDERAIKALDYVARRITYTADINPAEFWQFGFETLKRNKGDCEDGAILLASILINSGIPYWRIRLNAGDVQGGGHCYVTYLAEKDNTWYLLDWCYDYNLARGLNRTFKSAQDYFGIWFSWNKQFIFPNDELDRATLKAKGVKGI